MERAQQQLDEIRRMIARRARTSEEVALLLQLLARTRL